MQQARMLLLEEAIDSALAGGELTRAEEAAERYRRLAGEAPPGGDVGRHPWLRSRYLAAQVALAAGRLGQALEHLGPLLPVADTLPDEKLAGRIHLLAAETLARLRRPADARAELRQVPATLLGQNALARFRALRTRLWLGEVASLGDELSACAAALGAGHDTANLALLACDEGRAWDRAGDLARARECWQRAEALSRSAQGDPIRADVLLQLGRLDHLRGHLASALERYDEAVRHAGQGPHAPEIQWRRLLVRLDLGQWGPVRAAAERLRAAGPPEGLPEEVRPVAETVCGLLDGVTPHGATDEVRAFQAARRGERSAARSLYAAALAGTPSPERRARTALALGLLALNGRDAHEARSWLRQAEGLARSRDLPEVLAQALQVAGQIAAEQDGDDDGARKLFEEAVLVAEVQAGLLRNAVDRASHRSRGGSVLRQLLRSACRRGDAARVFSYQERERGRFLLDLLHSSRNRPARALPGRRAEEVAEIEHHLAGCERELAEREGGALRALLRRREDLLLRRDQLFEDFLRDGGRPGDSILPTLPGLDDLRRVLPAGAVYVAPTLAEDELFLLAVSGDRGAEVLRGSGSGLALGEQLERLRGCLEGQVARYRAGLLGRHDRTELDALLEDIGRGPLGDALARLQVAGAGSPRRVVWVPDGPLHGLPIHAVRRGGRYLVEDLEFVWTFSGALVVHQARNRRGRRFGPAVVVTEAPEVLPGAEREGRGVLATFLRGHRLPAASADRATVRAWLARARVMHFACHAEFDGRHPLTSGVRLPSGAVIRALDWLDEPVAGLPLVTLSACRSAGTAPLLGQEGFGLVTGLLGGGARAVLAALWPLPDRETSGLMYCFYRNRLEHDLAAALARTQRGALADPDSSPLFWAALALHGDGTALPAPGWFGRWLGRLRARRHAARFPDP
jgi:tetratricopeptide (TPR) repeat protein